MKYYPDRNLKAVRNPTQTVLQSNVQPIASL